MLRPIHHTFGPHVDFAYFLRTGVLLFSPWKWIRGESTKVLEEKLAQHFQGTTYLFGSGREALLALFRSLHLETGSEIIIQGYTCIVIPNAIHAAGYTPVYADPDLSSLNISPDTVEKAITPRTRVVLCQHTFGIPANSKKLREICDAHDLLFIEDCAHCIPDKSERNIGSEGDVVMLSFGRDKAISGIAGGALILRKKSVEEGVKKEWENAAALPRWTVCRLLLYPDAYFKTRLIYGFGLGKYILWMMKKLHLLIPIVTKEEKHGFQSPLLHRMPNVLAILVLFEWEKLLKINNHRRSIVRIYSDFATRKNVVMHCNTPLPLQKFPLLVQDADSIRSILKQKNIHLDDGWTGAVICPRNSEQVSYQEGSCPNAEQIGKQILTLPTHPTMSEKQAKKLCAALDPLL